MIGRMFGEYHVVERLGEGGMGTVYRAVDQMLERDVALKVLRPEVADQPELVERFRTEAVILARLNHPNIATLYRLAREGGRLFMVMELVRGRTLASLFARRGRLPLAHGASWCCQVLDAMQYAHDLGVVHRDLKPANLMVTNAGTIKVTDFGIARALGTGRQTRLGYVIGTPAYMSPEQVRGHEVDARSDIYALGMVLYELLTGRLPFEADDEFSLLSAQVSQAAPPPREFRGDLPASIDEAIARAIAKAPGDRFQAAEQFRTALEAGLTALAPEEEETAPGDLPPPRRKATTSPGIVRPSGVAGPIPYAKETRLAPDAAPSWAASAAGAVKETRLAEDGPVEPRTGAPARPEKRGWPPTAGSLISGLTWRHAVGAGALLIAVVASAAGIIRWRGASPAPGSEPGGRSGGRPQTVQTPASPGTPIAPVERPGGASLVPQEPPAQAPAGPQEPILIARPPGEPRPPVSRSRPSPPATPPPVIPTAQAPRTGRPGVEPPAAKPVDTEPAPAAGAPASSMTFNDVKFLFIEGDKTREIDALLAFDAEGLRVLVERSQAVFKVMPYRSISSAVYSHSKHPRGKERTGAAAIIRVLEAPISFLQGARHWLTIQSRDDFVVLRLDKQNYQTIIPAFETRTGVKVEIDKAEK